MRVWILLVGLVTLCTACGGEDGDCRYDDECGPNEVCTGSFCQRLKCTQNADCGSPPSCPGKWDDFGDADAQLQSGCHRRCNNLTRGVPICQAVECTTHAGPPADVAAIECDKGKSCVVVGNTPRCISKGDGGIACKDADDCASPTPFCDVRPSQPDGWGACSEIEVPSDTPLPPIRTPESSSTSNSSSSSNSNSNSSSNSSSTCCKVCTGSQACGDSCISRSSTCRTIGGCACNG